MSINLNTFWTTWGVLSGNTSATNQYDFWKGMVMTGGTQINSQYDFFTFNNTTRYKFFNDLNSTYPEVWDETTFYQNTNDARIYDYNTFYQYGAEYLSGGTPSPTFQSWDVYDSGGALDASCSSTSNTTYYSTGSTIQIGDIIYTNSALTTPIVGGGSGYDYVFIYPLDLILAPLFLCNIDTDGSIMSFNSSCPANFQFASGNTSSNACSSSSYDFSLNTSVSVGAQVWLITPNNISPTKFELFQGNNLFYHCGAGCGEAFMQVSSTGEVLNNGSC